MLCLKRVEFNVSQNHPGLLDAIVFTVWNPYPCPCNLMFRLKKKIIYSSFFREECGHHFQPLRACLVCRFGRFEFRRFEQFDSDNYGLKWHSDMHINS